MMMTEYPFMTQKQIDKYIEKLFQIAEHERENSLTYNEYVDVYKRLGGNQYRYY
jgi:Ca2+-binding EF-hand superfamily protein